MPRPTPGCWLHVALQPQRAPARHARIHSSTHERSHPLHIFRVLAPAANKVFSYTSATYNTTYLINTAALSWNDAEAFCKQQGGHLACWSDTSEQAEVEQYFIDRSQLLIPNMDAYWIGATASAAGTSNKWPNFR